jgi:hypothetical protein
MSDSSSGEDEHATTPPPSGPPPRYAGDRGELPPGFSAGPASTPPPGFGGAVPPPPGAYVGPAGPSLGQVPMPVPRTTTSTKPHRHPVPVALGLVAIAAIVGAAIWFFTTSDEDDANTAPGTPGAAILEWWSAMADEDYGTACGAMATVAVERLTASGGSCGDALDELNPDGLYDQGAETEVLDVVIEGDRARVTIEAGGSPLPEQDMLAIREGGRWRADPFGDAADLSAGADEGAAADAGAATTAPSTEAAPDGPGAAYTAWVRAIAGSDWTGACDLLSTSTLDEIAGRGATCEQTMEETAAQTGSVPGSSGGSVTVRILGEAVDGDRAEVSFQLGTEPPATEPAVLVREDGAWKLELFARSVGGGSVAGAQTAACRTEQRTVETAVAAYEAENGSLPPDADALVGRYLADLPPNMRVEADGTVTPVGDCA